MASKSRGDETPKQMANKQRHLERIGEAKAQLEVDAGGDPAGLIPTAPAHRWAYKSGGCARTARPAAGQGTAPFHRWRQPDHA
jgi:hypothetical protein